MNLFHNINYFTAKSDNLQLIWNRKYVLNEKQLLADCVFFCFHDHVFVIYTFSSLIRIFETESVGNRHSQQLDTVWKRDYERMNIKYVYVFTNTNSNK